MFRLRKNLADSQQILKTAHKYRKNAEKKQNLKFSCWFAEGTTGAATVGIFFQSFGRLYFEVWIFVQLSWRGNLDTKICFRQIKFIFEASQMAPEN